MNDPPKMVHRSTMPGTTEWKDITSESAKTANLTFTAKDANNNMKLRCAVKTSAGTMYSDAATLTVVRTDLAAPVLTGVSSTDTGVKVKWNVVEGAVNYRVFRKLSGGSWEKIGDTTNTSYTDKTGVKGKTYIYTVRCISADGKKYLRDYDKTGISIKYSPK